jgi:hypothetical protein
MNKENSRKKPNRNNSAKLKKSQLKNESKSNDHKNNKVSDEDGILVETARKVETSAKVIGEKAADVVEKVADQTTDIVDLAYDKVKKGVSDVFDVSSKTLADMSKKATKYIKKYEDTHEMKKLNHDRNIKMQELGIHIFTLYKSKSQNIS